MNKTEILNIVNEPSKHIQIVKIDGKDSIVYSSKFVEFLEAVPEMFTKDEVLVLLIKIRTRINNMYLDTDSMECIKDVIEEEINALRGEKDGKGIC